MRQYFKGYYFKCMEGDRGLALIPALHAGGKENHASLQVITEDQVYSIPYSDIKFDKSRFKIEIGHTYFSEKGVCLDADSKECKIYGKLKFGKFQKIKYRIMGPFAYIPFMQCKHTVVSMRHSVTGKIKINDVLYAFKNGIGYIEGDSGRSFPKEYIWTQCHYANGSLMLSAADIPFCGFRFKGIIGVIMIGDKEYRIATYLGARILLASDNAVVIKQGKYMLSAKLIEKKHQKLKAPVNGEMKRVIHESISCKASYKFTRNHRTLLEFVSDDASFEYERNSKW